MLTHIYTAKLSKSTHRSLDAFLHQQRELWNAGLEERIGAYSKAGKAITRYDQYKSLTQIRQADSDFSRYSVAAQRSSLAKLDKAFKSFFGRIKRGERPGFPRFKGRNRAIRSFDIPSPVINRSGRYHVLQVKGVGRLRFQLRKGYEGVVKVKSARVVKTPCRVNVLLLIDTPAAGASDQSPLGIDVGITNRVALSNGTRHAKAVRPTQRLKRLQRSLSRKQRGSVNRNKARLALAKEHQRVALSERNAAHRLTTALVERHSNRFYVESLNIKGMTRNHRLAKAIHEQSWSMLVQQLTYKAENAGGWVRRVDPRNTSQICSECGCTAKSKLTLSEREYRCSQCGYIEDRDVNAARNILCIGLTADMPGGSPPVHGKDEIYNGLVEPLHRVAQYAWLDV